MNIREVNLDNDYAELANWWTEYGWSPIPASLLPASGLIVPGLAAGFVYLSNSSLAWIEWVVGNPAAPSADRDAALEILIPALMEQAKAAGAEMAVLATKHKKLIGRLESHGFQASDTDMTHLVRRL